MPESHVLEMVEVIKSIDPVSASGDTNGSSVDVSKYRSVAFYVYYGTFSVGGDGSNYFECHLEDSDDDSTFADVAANAAYLVGASTNKFGVANNAADDNAVYGLGYRGNKRYVRPVLDETGTAAVPVAIIAVGIPKKRPASYTVQGS